MNSCWRQSAVCRQLHLDLQSDRYVSLLFYPAVFSPFLNLFSILATHRSHLFESICRQRISVSRLSQASVLGEGFFEVGHFAKCPTGKNEGISHGEMQAEKAWTTRINQRRRAHRLVVIVPLPPMYRSRNLGFHKGSPLL